MGWQIEHIKAAGEGSDIVRLHMTLALAEPGAHAKLVAAANQAAAQRLETVVRAQLADRIAELDRLRAEVGAADNKLADLRRQLDDIPPARQSAKVAVDCLIYDTERRRNETMARLVAAYKDARAALPRILRGESATVSMIRPHLNGMPVPVADGSMATRDQLCTVAGGILRELAAAAIAQAVEQRADVGRDELARLLGTDPEGIGAARSMMAAAAGAADAAVQAAYKAASAVGELVGATS